MNYNINVCLKAKRKNLAETAASTRKFLKMVLQMDTVSCVGSEDLNESNGRFIHDEMFLNDYLFTLLI